MKPLIHRFTLSFKDNALEQQFTASTIDRTRAQGQIAILIGMFVYILTGAIDFWFIPADTVLTVWLIRIAALCVPAIVFLISLTTWLREYFNLLLAIVGFAAGIGIIALQALLPLEVTSYYYPIMIVITFYTYNFVGTRFINALVVDLTLLIAYNIIFGLVLDYPVAILVAHNVIIISANLIGGTAGYIAEKHRRVLFLRARELDLERYLQQQRSLHDPLTGLANRELLYDRISQAISSANRDTLIHCGMFLDIDNFKTINDTLGHEMGDKALCKISSKLCSIIRETDTVSRIGGDEFFIVMQNVKTIDSIANTAENILNQVNLSLSEERSVSVDVSVSIGVCVFPYEGMTVSDIIKRADQAMYQAKEKGKGCFSFSDCSEGNHLQLMQQVKSEPTHQ